MDVNRREPFSNEHALSIKKETEDLSAELEVDILTVQTPARAATFAAPFRTAEMGAKGKRKAEWFLHPSAGSQQQAEHSLLNSLGKKMNSGSSTIQAHRAAPSQDRPSQAAGVFSDPLPFDIGPGFLHIASWLLLGQNSGVALSLETSWARRKAPAMIHLMHAHGGGAANLQEVPWAARSQLRPS